MRKISHGIESYKFTDLRFSMGVWIPGEYMGEMFAKVEMFRQQMWDTLYERNRRYGENNQQGVSARLSEQLGKPAQR